MTFFLNVDFGFDLELAAFTEPIDTGWNHKYFDWIQITVAN